MHAGGEKYIVRGILFKFAVDSGIFAGNHVAAAKVAGRELTSILSVWNKAIRGLSVPLMCLVDYKGFRLVAMSVLPIGKDTIVYGSDTG